MQAVWLSTVPFYFSHFSDSRYWFCNRPCFITVLFRNTERTTQFPAIWYSVFGLKENIRKVFNNIMWLLYWWWRSHLFLSSSSLLPTSSLDEEYSVALLSRPRAGRTPCMTEVRRNMSKVSEKITKRAITKRKASVSCATDEDDHTKLPLDLKRTALLEILWGHYTCNAQGEFWWHLCIFWDHIVPQS